MYQIRDMKKMGVKCVFGVAGIREFRQRRISFRLDGMTGISPKANILSACRDDGNFAKGEYPFGLPTVSKLPSLCAEDANPLALRATGIKAPFPDKKATARVAFLFGADDGNRTRVFGLGSERSTIELHLHMQLTAIIIPQRRCFVNGFFEFCCGASADRKRRYARKRKKERI